MRRASASAKRSPGRPQAAEVTERILEQTIAILAARGYHGLTIDEIAAKCGTSKQAVYRRWPSKSALVAAAIEGTLAKHNPEPPAGRLREALCEALGNLAELVHMTPFGRAVLSIAAVFDDRELESLLKRVEARRRQLMRDVILRGRNAGEYPADRDMEADIDTLLGAIYFRFAFRRHAVDRSFARTVVAAWADGLPSAT
jgi:AcrR family transcriptional regulator